MCSPSGVNIGIYQSANAMQGLETWQDQVARNLASSSVPGYQRQAVHFESFLTDSQKSSAAFTGRAPTGLLRSASHIEFSQGQVQHTGLELDFAVREGTFFQAQLPNGQVLFTRDGHFALNGEGVVVTRQGHPVLVDGAPLVLPPGGGPVTANPAGELSRDGQILGKLDLFGFDRPENLTPISGGFLALDESAGPPRRIDDPRLQQGFLESSNVSPVQEMANLITLSRAYEMHQRLIRHQDESHEKAIQYLNPSAAG